MQEDATCRDCSIYVHAGKRGAATLQVLGLDAIAVAANVVYELARRRGGRALAVTDASTSWWRNAGIYPPVASIEDMSDADFDLVMDINLGIWTSIQATPPCAAALRAGLS